MKRTLAVITMVLLFSACDRSGEGEIARGKIVASAFGKDLYLNDLQNQIPDGISLDEHFAGAGGGNRLLDVAQDLGTACLGDFDSVHVTIIPVVRSQ